VGFSVRVAPGVRVRASSRGVRTSIGPRAARVHVGGGRTGVSTGVGPVGYYTSVGASGRRSRSSAGASQRQLAAATKAAEAQELNQAIQAILAIHRENFPPATPLKAPPPPAVDRSEVEDRHRRAALQGIGVFQRTARSAAIATAKEAARQEIAERVQAGIADQERRQVELDEAWRQLLANDPATLMATLAAAFEDNDAAAAPVGIEGGEAIVVVLSPSESTLPERMPTVTDAGNLSLRKVTKAQQADLYKALVCGHILVTAKEALAVGQGLDSVRIVALRDGGRDSYGKPRVDCIMAIRLTRKSLEGIRWQEAHSPDIVGDAADELLWNPRGVNKQITPIDLADQPDIRRLIDAVDLEDLTGH
jgi:hypothetical protein